MRAAAVVIRILLVGRVPLSREARALSLFIFFNNLDTLPRGTPKHDTYTSSVVVVINIRSTKYFEGTTTAAVRRTFFMMQRVFCFHVVSMISIYPYSSARIRLFLRFARPPPLLALRVSILLVLDCLRVSMGQC